VDPVALSLFANRMEAICDEMGAVLRRTAFSSNIKDRLDFSCALFDATGQLCAQAAHIPVHLGSMAFAMGAIVRSRRWVPGEVVVVNDPFLGGTHLPDVTATTPVFAGEGLVGFAVNRAHHADIGAESPGSMPVSRTLDEEGLLIPPTPIARAGALDEARIAAIVARAARPEQARADLVAQASANRVGAARLQALAEQLGSDAFTSALGALNAYGERLARTALDTIPPGRYAFQDVLDDDGAGHFDLPIRVAVTAAHGEVWVDFAGTAPQTPGNVNCPLPVTAAAVHYVFRCLMPAHTPACAGSLRPVHLEAPEGSLVNARRPAAVAAGNVETSSRIVDAVLGALAPALPERIPAASQGTMNNVAMGSRAPGRAWDYYETLAGGMGAGPSGGGLDAVHTHMTNTLNTPVEALELAFPLRVRRYALLRGSGGGGARPGGAGLVREYEFLEDTTVTLLTERRRHRPWGLAGGRPGRAGANRLSGTPLPGKASLQVSAGERLTIETPGGGGWGPPPPADPAGEAGGPAAQGRCAPATSTRVR
jgi:N-methylhydantoinase B